MCFSLPSSATSLTKYTGDSTKPPPDKGSVRKKPKPAVPAGRPESLPQLHLAPMLRVNAPPLVSTSHRALAAPPAGESVKPLRKPAVLLVHQHRPPNSPRKSPRPHADPADTCPLTCALAPTQPPPPLRRRIVTCPVLRVSLPSLLPGRKHLPLLPLKKESLRNGCLGSGSSRAKCVEAK